MSNCEDVLWAKNDEVECIHCNSDSYIEKLSIKSIEAQPWLVELMITTQLLSAKNPEELRVKSRTCIERTRLAELQGEIGVFLPRTSSSGELDTTRAVPTVR